MVKLKLLSGLWCTLLLAGVGTVDRAAAEPVSQGNARPATTHAGKPLPDAPFELTAEEQAALAQLERTSQGYAIIADRVKPSVVSIRAMVVNKDFNAELRKMLGDEDLQMVPIAGTGSGVIIDTDGHIVTNNHVVEDADAVRVTLADGREVQARIIGTDRMSDLAVIKIDADGLTACRFGDSDKVRAGHIVFAIGSPFKFGHSVSHGIISAIGRSNVEVDIDYKNWLQTDAPINPGNSGGPLISTKGEVIGISVAIATESGGYQGVGFAIPANTVVRVAERLKRGEQIVRGYLGVEIKPVRRPEADVYGLKDVRGALLGTIGKESPAARAGLKPEDIVLSIDGQYVQSLEHLQDAVAWTPPGTKSVFKVWRRGKEQDVIVEIGKQPPWFRTQGTPLDLQGRDPDAQEDRTSRRGKRRNEPTTNTDATKSVPRAPEGEFFEKLGMFAATLTPELRERFQIPESSEDGVVITQVDPLGEAYQADLRRGFVIRKLNDDRIETLSEFKAAIEKLKDAKGVRLQVQANRQIFYTVVKLR